MDHALTRSVPCAKSPGFPGYCISRSGPRWRFESPLFSHPSTSPALDLQVTPRSRSSLQRLPMHLRVTPHFASSGFAGVRSSGCPESRLLSALPAVFKFRVSPSLYFARRASRCITGFPGLCIFRPCRRPIIELPRFSSPLAPLVRRLRVSPLLRSSSCASRHRSRVTPFPASSGSTGNDYSSYPELSFFGAPGA